jgi:Spy/CpxP family protein refolding chaperone
MVPLNNLAKLSCNLDQRRKQMKRLLISTALIAAVVLGATTFGTAAHAETPQGGYGPGTMGGGMMGPGMMGGGMMGPGMMGGYGPGYGMGPGMMCPAMMGGMMGGGMMGPGMMGGGMMGPGMMGGGMMGPGMMHGMGYGMLYQLGLSPEQWNKVNAIHEEIAKKHWDLMGSTREEAFKLRGLMAAESRDRTAITNQYKKLQELRLQRFQARIDAHERLDGVLTKEQREQLRRFAPWRGRDVR